MQRAALVAWGLVAALGAAAIWGSALGVPRLRDFGADFAPMVPATALAFLLLAAGYLASERGARRTAWAASAVVAVLALLGLVEELGDVRLAGMQAGMSFAMCCTLLALAVATPLQRERRLLGFSLNAAAASLIAAVGFFVLLGLTLRLLRFDIAAPLLGFSAPAGRAAG